MFFSKAKRLAKAAQQQRWAEASKLLNGSEPIDSAMFREVVGHAPVAVVKEWIEAGADLRGVAGESSEPPLNTAVLANRLDLIDLLVEKGADPGQTDATGLSPLMAAAYLGRVQLVISLLRLGAPTEQADQEGFTPIMWAANAGHAACVKMLLLGNANPNARDKTNSTPAMFAAQGGHLDALEAIVGAGADLSVVGTHGLTALGFAKQNRHDSVVKWLENLSK